MTSRHDPTPAERAALEDYAATHGGHWKRELLDDWTNGRAVGILQQIRKTRGPSWLLRHFAIARKRTVRAVVTTKPEGR